MGFVLESVRLMVPFGLRRPVPWTRPPPGFRRAETFDLCDLVGDDWGEDGGGMGGEG